MGIRLAMPIAVAAVAGAMLLTASSPPQAAATDLDCDDFSNQATAQEYLRPGDPYFLDADNDGVACEDLPCPCVGKGKSSGQATSAPRRLEMNDARRMARKVAREFAQSDGNLTTVTVGKCERRAEQHVNCLAVDSGKSDTTKTICHLRVAVRGSQPLRAKLASNNCRTRSTLTLTEADALAAISAEMTELVAQPVRILGAERTSRISFTAVVEWTRPSQAGLEKCSAIPEAKLWDRDRITVSIPAFDCFRTRAP